MTGYLVTYSYLFSLIGVIGVLNKLLKFKADTARKLIHILLCFTWMLLYHYFWRDWQILIIPISFILINYISYKFKIFKMIERESGELNHKGTIYFAISITLLMGVAFIFPSTIMQSGTAVFCLCFGDGFAALFGRMFKKRIMIRPNKSLQGTIACFAGAVLGLIIFAVIMNYSIPWHIIIVLSAATAILEMVEYGLDNFSITLGTYLLAVTLLR